MSSRNDWTVEKHEADHRNYLISPDRDERIILELHLTDDDRGSDAVAEKLALFLSNKAVLTPVFTYDELDDKAKETAREAHVHMLQEAGETMDADLFIDDSRHTLKTDFGLDSHGDIEVLWSLGYCQGDGVAFTGRLNPDTLFRHNPEIAAFVALEIGENVWRTCDVEIGIEVTNGDRHYCHWNTMRVETELDINEDEAPGAYCHDRLDGFETELDAMVKEILRAASRKCEANGYAMIEGAQSDETVAEALRDDDIVFTATGHGTVAI